MPAIPKEGIASASSATGEHYTVKLKAGSVLTTNTWLKSIVPPNEKRR